MDALRRPSVADGLVTRVVVCADSQLLQRQVRKLLAESHAAEVIGAAGEVGAAIGLIERLAPDAVVLDLRLVGGAGTDVLAAIARLDRRPDVVALVDDPASESARRLPELGVGAVLHRRRELDRLLPALGLKRVGPTPSNAWKAVAERLEGLVDYGGDLIFAVDDEGRVRYASASVARALGHAPEAVRERLLFDLVHPDDAGAVSAALDRVVAGDPAAALELRLRTHDGGWLWTAAALANRLADPRVQAVLVSARDVSARKAHEAALAERAREQEALAELGYRALAERDLPVFLDEVAQAVRTVLGVDVAEVLELEPGGGRLRLVAAAGWPHGLVGTAVVDAAPDTLAGYALVAGDVVVTDAECETRFGPAPLLAAQGVRAGATAPIDAPAVGLLGAHVRGPRTFGAAEVSFLRAVATLVGAAMDRHALLRDVRANEARYRGLLENAAEAVFVAAPDGRLREVNPRACELTGYDRDALLARPLDDLFAPADRPTLAAVLGGLGSHDAAIAERAVLAADGRLIDVECAARSLPDGGFLVSLRDVTERRALQAQLVQAQKLEGMGALAGGVAHELNNALSVIGGCAHLLQRDLEAGTPHPADLDDILAAAGRAQAVTRQLLAFSRRLPLDPQVVSVADLVGGMRAVLERLLRADVELAWDVQPGTGAVRVDPGALEQVIVNLVMNARDAMPEGGRLTIAARATDLPRAVPAVDGVVPAGRYVVVEVEDTGVGMDRATLARAFEPLFSTKGAGGGTGLGLSTVLSLVQQSGGQVVVASEPGRGTAVRLFLPGVAAEEAAPPAPASGGTETILLVEDEAAVRHVTRQLLQRRGYSVLAAATPDEALAIAATAETQIHLLLSDVVIPDITGPKLARLLRALRPGLPVVFVSGYAEEAVVKQIAQIEGARFLAKPVDPDALLVALRNTLDQAAG
jgi:PAS domain S-box-containing protein